MMQAYFVRVLKIVILLLYCVPLSVLFPGHAVAQTESWQNSSYPDEGGYQRRISGMVNRIAAQEFGKRSLSRATCPDTGLPVMSWALEGETIISPYTGRTFRQGNTGYFGPKERDTAGRITFFGGDPLKYDLPPAAATLLLEPENRQARAFLSIPGNLRQQYHFAAKNWARFYPMLADQMGAEWKQAFWAAVANYSESRRPSDGNREYAPMSKPHNLVGEPGELLGGNKKDGGTENHKTMWRTTALLYSQLFPDSCQISGVPVPQAKALTYEMLSGFAQRILVTGNGEYDSQIYYPHAMYGFYNLHDFSPDPATRELAKFMLDFYWATYGLKVIDGAIAGAQKRGFLTGSRPNETRTHLWAYMGSYPGTPASGEGKKLISSLHQATSSYRPNKIIWNLTQKNVPLPFEARIARPTYHTDQPNTFQEYFYADSTFALGSIAMGMVDNAGQQVVWSLVTKEPEQPLSFGGMQPRFLNPAGHSPYTQTLQHRNQLIVLTGQTDTTRTAATVEQQHRRQHGSAQLVPAPGAPATPEEWKSYLEAAPQFASTWFFYPATCPDARLSSAGIYLIETEQNYIAVYPLADTHHPLNPSKEVMEVIGEKAPKADIFKEYKVIAFNGNYAGYGLWVQSKSRIPDAEIFAAKAAAAKPVLSAAGKVNWSAPDGGNLQMVYQPDRLRAEGNINGRLLSYQNWAGGLVYDSPYLKIGKGEWFISDGREAFQITFKNNKLVVTAVNRK